MQAALLGGNVRRVMGAAPLILVSNDDGIHSEGIAALATGLRRGPGRSQGERQRSDALGPWSDLHTVRRGESAGPKRAYP